MNVPFLDLRAQQHPIQGELGQAIDSVVQRGDYILGGSVRDFEEDFAAFCGVRYAVGVDSGLSALELSLRALGVGPGDEVILPTNTFIATAAAVTFCGATPVLVDVDPQTYALDLDQTEAAITTNTRAIIPVHLYGLPVMMDPIMDLASKHDLYVVEDACQAHGARYQGKRTGSLGHAAAFSFYPSKNLGAFGDGGMVVTNKEDVADLVRAMRNCGQREKNLHEFAPFNRRLDTIQAAVLRVKLPHLDEWNAARGQSAALYRQLLAESKAVTPTELPSATHVYHLYVIRTPMRDELQAFLRERDIHTGIHYPIPIHLQPFYAQMGYKRGQFPIAERMSNEILSLPMFPELSTDQVHYVAEQVVEATISLGQTIKATT